MRKPRTLKAAKGRAWVAISKHIRQKFANDSGFVSCVTCGKREHWKNLHCGHYQHGLTYYEEGGRFEVIEENLAPQCPGCNTYRGGMLDRYTLYILDTYGREMVDDLQAMKSAQKDKPLKMKIDDYYDIEKRYV